MAGMKSLIAWWQSLPLPWRGWRIVTHVLAGDEVPERLPHRGIVLVGFVRQRDMGPSWTAHAERDIDSW